MKTKDREATSRADMFKLFSEKKVSLSTKGEICRLFENLEDREKELLARKIVPLMEQSNTEQEMLNKIMGMNKS